MRGNFYGEGKYIFKNAGYYQGEYKNLTGKYGGPQLPLPDGKRHGFGIRVFSNCKFLNFL